MTDTLAHWVEMAWAARDAAEPDMNAERRQAFDNLRPLILERDLPKSVTSKPEANQYDYYNPLQYAANMPNAQNIYSLASLTGLYQSKTPPD